MHGTTRGRRGTCTAGLLVVGVLLVGCAQREAGQGGSPPILRIAAPAGVAQAGAAAPVTAEGTASGRMPIFGGYVLAGPLPDRPTHAPVWRWSGDKASAKQVAGLGNALGISGTPQRHAYGWALTSAAGELRVRDGGSGEWSYVRADYASCPPYGIDIDNPAGGGFGCATASGTGTVTPVGTAEVSAAPVPTTAPTTPTTPAAPTASPAAPAAPAATPATPATPPTPPATGPDEGTTRSAAHGLLGYLGLLGISGRETVYVAPGTSTLTLSPTLHSLPTQGIETRVDVDARGIRSATGRLALPTAAADYPLRTAKQAFDDLGNGPRPMLAPYCGPLPMGSGGAELGAPQPAPASAPVAQAPGPMPCPTPKPVAITAATIGLLLTWEGTQGGSALLVPAWFFTTAGSDYPVVTIAIDPHYLGSPSGPSGPAGSTAPSGSAGPAGPAGNVTSSAVP